MKVLDAIRWTWRESNLPGPERAVLTCLILHADNDGRCWVKRETLAAESGYQVRRTVAAIRELERRNLICRQVKPRTPPLYTVHLLHSAPDARCISCTVHLVHFQGAFGASENGLQPAPEAAQREPNCPNITAPIKDIRASRVAAPAAPAGPVADASPSEPESRRTEEPEGERQEGRQQNAPPAKRTRRRKDGTETDPRVRPVIDLYRRLWREEFGEEPAVHYARDGKAIRSLPKDAELPTIERRLRLWFGLRKPERRWDGRRREWVEDKSLTWLFGRGTIASFCAAWGRLVDLDSEDGEETEPERDEAQEVIRDLRRMEAKQNGDELLWLQLELEERARRFQSKHSGGPLHIDHSLAIDAARAIKELREGGTPELYVVQEALDRLGLVEEVSDKTKRLIYGEPQPLDEHTERLLFGDVGKE